MLIGSRSRREGTYKLLTFERIAARLGLDDIRSVEHAGPGWSSGMRRQIGKEFIINKRVDGLVTVITNAKTGERIENVSWDERWFEQIEEKVAQEKTKDVDFSKPELTVSLEGGAIEFNIETRKIREADEKGIFILDLADHLEDVQSVPDWFLLTEMCVTNFGEAPDKRFIYVNVNALSNPA